MCGINGILSRNRDIKQKIIQQNKLLRHRGPDDEGFACINTQNGNIQSFSGDDSIDFAKRKFPHILTADLNNWDLVLGHRRLSIIDLSEHGHGPMSDTSDKFWITFNGEIYNYIEIREELKTLGYNFNSETDTEVILYSYIQWGVDCLNHFNGMWAFAIWDNVKKSLFLARDRFGVKPLYYTITDSYFAFSSEIKPLLLLNPLAFEVNKTKISFFILYGNRLNSDETYIKNIYSLKASHYMIYKDKEIITKRYYDIAKTQHPIRSDKELEDTLLDMLRDSIRLRFRSDVPVGTCLSGGFDSSSIVSLAPKVNSLPLNTFSAVWSDKECDESNYVDIINNHFQCSGNKIEPCVSEFETVFNKINYFQELPTEGPGLYPQWYVMQEAHNKVKVLLNGQGGDEDFGGYLWLATYLRAFIEDLNFPKILSNLHLYIQFLYKNGAHTFSSWLFPGIYDKVVRGLISKNYKILNADVLQRIKKNELSFDINPPKKFEHYLNNLSYHFIYNYTIPGLLHYEDRSSMAHSIESRTPFLDYRLVEFGVNLEARHLVHKNVSRPLFRKALKRQLPNEIITRKDKLGYPTPFAKWSRNELKHMISDILLDTHSGIYDYLSKKQVPIMLAKHNNENKDYSWQIWRLLSLDRFLKLKNCLCEITPMKNV
jgi:asparagine synthase (glutamine-hydrolysing)